MKTKEQFAKIETHFRDAINGKSGEEFMIAVINFMTEHKFENNIIVTLHRSNTGNIMFFTDHYLNDTGFVFIEIYDTLSAFFVGSKAEAKKIIHNRC